MEKEKPFFSIITPFYNSGRFINSYLEKLCLQTFINWECILIDDYSEDNGYEIIKNLTKEDDRIKVYKNILSKNIKSPYQERNFGISLARGKYICFLDIDDFWMKNMLEIKYQVLYKRKEIDLVFTNYLKTKNYYEKMVSPIRSIPIKYQLKIHNPIGMLTSTVRRDLIKNQKFKCINHEDYIFWAELFNKNKDLKIKYLNKVLAIYKVSDDSISSNKLLSLKWHYDCYLVLGYKKLVAKICFIPLLLFKSIVWIKLNLSI